MVGILGKKVGMTNLFSNGKMVAVTVVKSGPCHVAYTKSKERDGYTSVALSFDPQKEHRVTKPLLGVFKKAGVEPAKFVREFRTEDLESYQLGQKIDVDSLKDVKYVDVVGTSKGKGFQGVMKRHGFSGGPKSHGASLFHRRTGSIGSMASEGKVVKGKKMPGRMGNSRVTVKRLEIIERDAENNILVLKGSIPGSRNGYLIIKPSAER